GGLPKCQGGLPLRVRPWGGGPARRARAPRHHVRPPTQWVPPPLRRPRRPGPVGDRLPDRKSTRLNSSHVSISYAVFCLKKNEPGSDCERQPRCPADDGRACERPCTVAP